ncbi:winged helix-turn-helix transcriptional regulator [Spirosoma sp. RP8]|uniref:Winged helix-turn-helix transcriptional regulator n=1 Tax=Spirosoma liriopis TaxID=2937440 RepID=A0ABT0HV32_9BACT|nr:winged helix-turn-helix transcriptional regulator [Spirosoma liriopis]
MLADELKTLFALGVVQRTAYVEIPPRVEYTLTLKAVLPYHCGGRFNQSVNSFPNCLLWRPSLNSPIQTDPPFLLRFASGSMLILLSALFRPTLIALCGPRRSFS